MPLILLSPFKKIVTAIRDAFTKYASLNSNDRNINAVLTESNLHYEGTGCAGVRATMSRISGKWYWEATVTKVGSNFGVLVGVASKATPLDSTLFNSTANWTLLYSKTSAADSQILRGTATSSRVTNLGGACNVGDVIGVALVLTGAATIQFFKNGVPFPVQALGAYDAYFPIAIDPGGENVVGVKFNFGETPFKYSAPEEHLPLSETAYGWSETKKAANVVLSNNFRTLAVANATGWGIAATDIALASGKYYWEISGITANCVFGIGEVESFMKMTPNEFKNALGNPPNTVGFRGGQVFLANWPGVTSATPPAIAANSVVGLALDMDRKCLFISVNGVWLNSANPANLESTVGRFLSGFGAKAVAPAVGMNSTTATANFAASDFKYTPPSGYSPLPLAPI